MLISLVVAIAQNGVIGAKNGLPWRLPADLKHFKVLTWGKPIIMGHKTFKSLGRPLLGRRNMVVSHSKAAQAPDCEIYGSLEAAFDAVSDYEEVMIIGGASIYQQALPRVERIYLTRIHQDFEGDTLFTPWDEAAWCELERQDFNADEKYPHAYSFIKLER